MHLHRLSAARGNRSPTRSAHRVTDDQSSVDDPAEVRPDRRQALLVGAAIIALLITAFLVPPSGLLDGGDGNDTSERDNSAPQETTPVAPDDTGGDGGILFEWGEWLRWLLPLEPDPSTPTEPTDERCEITLDSTPHPGQTLTVRATINNQPLTDAPVWFNSQRIGRTDTSGEIQGTVPYAQELTITVNTHDHGECTTPTTRIDPAQQSAFATRYSHSMIFPSDQGPSPQMSATRQTTPPTNASVTYEVDGHLRIDILDDPYPDTAVDVAALMNDRPLPDATVSVDGTTVGTTDTTGRTTIRLPDDGRDVIDLTVTRGEFRTTRSVTLLRLSVDLAATSLAVVPGADATVEASFADQPAADANVTIAGAYQGTTNDDGRFPITVPPDPRVPVTVTANDQTATTSVVAEYRVIVGFLGVLVGLLASAAYWRRGRRAALTVIGVAGTISAIGSAIIIADAFYGQRGRYTVLTTAIGVSLVIVGHRRRDAIAGFHHQTKRYANRLRSWLSAFPFRHPFRTARNIRAWSQTLVARLQSYGLHAVVRVASHLETFIQTAIAQLQLLAETPHMLPTLLKSFLARASSRLRIFFSPPPTLLTWLGLATIIAGGAIVVVSPNDSLLRAAGFVVILTSLVVIGTYYWHRRQSGRTARQRPETDASTSRVASGSDVNDFERPLPELWRAFAKHVVGENWRTRTPGEVATMAIDRGYPREPVAELTLLFREVEYGRQALTDRVNEQAAMTYTTLRTHDPEAEAEGETDS